MLADGLGGRGEADVDEHEGGYRHRWSRPRRAHVPAVVALDPLLRVLGDVPSLIERQQAVLAALGDR
jgi:hypothetical protein